MRAFRPLPRMHPLLQGVAEHKGELFPVLDIALCFGRRTQVRTDAKMILMKNGNFRALILTEDIPVRRLLLPNEHKDVPVNLPHRYLYGCYIDENIVRLILDIETIAVCSRNYAVSEDFNNLTKAMADSGLAKKREPSRGLGKRIKTKHKPAAVTAKPGEYTESAVFSEIMVGKDSEEAHDAEGLKTAEEEAGAEKVGLEGEAEEGLKTAEEEAGAEKVGLEGEAEEGLKTAEEEAGAEKVGLEGATLAGLEAGKSKAGMETGKLKNLQQGLSHMKERLTSGINGLTKNLQEVLNKTKRYRLVRPVDKDERKLLSSLITVLFAGKRRNAWFILIVLCIAFIVYLAMQYPHYPPGRTGETVVTETKGAYVSEGEDTVSRKYPEGKMLSGARTSGKTEEEERKAAAAEPETLSGGVEETAVFMKPGKTEKEERKAAAAEPGTLSGGVEETAVFMKPGKTEEEERKAAAAEPETLSDRMEDPFVFLKPEAEYKDSTLLLMEVEKKTGKIFLSTDFATPAGANVYIVKKGDTLWHIAARFTGNPFNYHYIAEDSEIKNPDLIFPGQKVIVIIRDKK
jgi:nucleoid-associated protein YgaU